MAALQRHEEALKGVREQQAPDSRCRRQQGAAQARRAFQAAGVNSLTRLTG